MPKFTADISVTATVEALDIAGARVLFNNSVLINDNGAVKITRIYDNIFPQSKPMQDQGQAPDYLQQTVR